MTVSVASPLTPDAGSARAAIVAASRGWRPYALLVLLCLGLYLPGLASLPVTDRDEARFAQATRQMLESHDFLRIRFQDDARNKKPAAIYWLQAASVASFSDAASNAIWPYRVPSLLGALAAVLMTFAFGARLVGRETALLGAALLAASLELTVEAHIAKTDAVLLATAVAAQGALGEIYRRTRERVRVPARWALLFWAAQGAGILVKGPVAPALSVLTVAALIIADRDWRWLKEMRAVWGVLLVIVMVAPWLVAMMVATQGTFIADSVGHDFLGKLSGAQESHGAWPGYYLLLVAATFWPGSLLLGAGGLAAWRGRSDTAIRFLVAWIVPFWIVLEATPTKLPHYLLPVFPALALLAAQGAMGLSAGLPTWLARASGAIWALASMLIVGTLVVAPIELGRGIDVAGIVLGVVIAMFGWSLARRLLGTPAPSLAIEIVLLGLVVTPAAIALEAPRLDPLWLSRGAARMVAAYRPPPGVPAAVVGYAEPSIVFLLGTDTVLASPADAARRITSARGAVALVEERDDAAFQAALKALGWQAEVVDRTAGVDYSNGKRMTLTLYRGVPG